MPYSGLGGDGSTVWSYAQLISHVGSRHYPGSGGFKKNSNTKNKRQLFPPQTPDQAELHVHDVVIARQGYRIQLALACISSGTYCIFLPGATMIRRYAHSDHSATRKYPVFCFIVS